MKGGDERREGEKEHESAEKGRKRGGGGGRGKARGERGGQQGEGEAAAENGGEGEDARVRAQGHREPGKDEAKGQDWRARKVAKRVAHFLRRPGDSTPDSLSTLSLGGS